MTVGNGSCIAVADLAFCHPEFSSLVLVACSTHGLTSQLLPVLCANLLSVFEYIDSLPD